MTVEERAKTVTDEVGTATTGAELRALIAQALREQIEDCAQIADHLLTSGGRSTAQMIGERIRALANQTEEIQEVEK